MQATSITSPVTSPCSWCKGSKFEPITELSSVTCTHCDGGGLEPISGDLGPTRSCPDGRPFVYNPGRRFLTITRKRLVETYDVFEFVADRFPGEAPSRAFEVIKRSDGEVYHVRIGGEFSTCDCRGFTSEASRRGDERAWESGGQVFFTLGCIHADALSKLVIEGRI